MGDQRIVAAGPGRGEVREKASRFLAFAFPAEEPEAALLELGRLRREYHDATHVAFAWKLGVGDAARRRSADAGEPSGTAGRPIAAAIDASGMTDVVVAVVRYYGGTKLGTGGLARAYREAADRALQSAGRRAVEVLTEIEVRCPFASSGAVRRLLQHPGTSLIEETFDDGCVFRIAVVRSAVPRFVEALHREQLSYRIERD